MLINMLQMFIEKGAIASLVATKVAHPVRHHRS